MPSPTLHNTRAVESPCARPGARSPREGAHVTAMQRSRLLTATTEIVYVQGAPSLTTASVIDRAGVSRRTFYDIFPHREACLLAAFNHALATATETATTAAAAVPHAPFRERVRHVLVALLSLFDRDPALARLLVVEALACGTPTLTARATTITHLATLLDGASPQRDVQPSPLTAQATIGAVLSLLHTHLLARPTASSPRGGGGEEPNASLLSLTNPLTVMLLTPYLSRAAALRELHQPTPQPLPLSPPPSDPFKDLTIRLTYRTLRVLTTIARTPGSSSKQVALSAGITDEGQTSKLLKRLATSDLIADTGDPGKGMPRAWTLTPRGVRVLTAVGAG
jgi:AcrR family transcriptional regulator